MVFSIFKLTFHVPNSRNKAKLQAYQWEYAQQKQAPGHRKIKNTEQKLLEEQHVHKCWFMSIEGVLAIDR